VIGTAGHLRGNGGQPVLDGVRVLDVSTIYAGPLAAMLLGDYGAEVVKLEHPRRGDPLRTHGPAKNGHGLWWKMLSRNKHAATLDLSHPRGQELFLALVERADVVVESFRPGVMERWGLGHASLAERNPGVVMLRMSGFGQTGPYAPRRGFGTLAEAMSGFAAMTGDADGPPTLPPFGLADGIAGIAGAFAALLALRARDRSGVGQEVDVSLVEPLLLVLGAQATMYDQLGIVPQRTGNRSTNNAPRNTYRTRDGKWLAISTSALSVAERVMELVGRPDLALQPWFATGRGRAEHADELDAIVAGWVAERDRHEAVTAFADAGAAAAPVYGIDDLLADPHFEALETFITVQDDDLGAIRMQNVVARLSATPGRVRFTGRSLGADNATVYGDLAGLSEDDLTALAEEGVL
jgi:crotonobetainyl-CoA:carnitine CoA-transferase CaiB-like acyl-CoA transferase